MHRFIDNRYLASGTRQRNKDTMFEHLILLEFRKYLRWSMIWEREWDIIEETPTIMVVARDGTTHAWMVRHYGFDHNLHSNHRHFATMPAVLKYVIGLMEIAEHERRK